jgi:putative chitinase
MFNRETFFEAVRSDPFGGSLIQDQVDGMNYILDTWEDAPPTDDLRWLAYALATTYHETAATMLPIAEYGYGAGRPYGVPDPETGQTYYGRGFVQLTWRDNYARADHELELFADDCLEWHADNALEPPIAAAVMFKGMTEGWFCGSALADYFNDHDDDPYNARDIINGDKSVVPSWSGGMSIGNLIKGHHEAFLMALEAAWYEDRVLPMAAETVLTLTLRLSAAGPVKVISVEAHTDALGSNEDAMLVKAQPQAHRRTVAAHDRAFAPKVGDPQTAALFGAVVQRKAGKRDGPRNIKAPDPPAQGGSPLPASPKGTKGRSRNPSGVRSAPSD